MPLWTLEITSLKLYLWFVLTSTSQEWFVSSYFCFFFSSWLKTNLCGCFSNFVTVIYNGPTSVEHCGLFNYSSEILKVSLGSKILLQMIGQNKTILYLQIYLEKNPRNNNWGISNCLCSFASQKHLCHLGNCKSSWINYHAAFLEANLHNCYHYAECE